MNGEVLIVAEGLKDAFLAANKLEGRVLATFQAQVLERKRCKHPFYDRDSIVLLGEHVTLEAGASIELPVRLPFLSMKLKGGPWVWQATRNSPRWAISSSVPADAVIEGDAVAVSAPGIDAPVHVRYAWANDPPCTLFNREGLPASPFRTTQS